MKYLLDANVLLHVANKAEGWRAIVARLESTRPSRRAISAIASFELRRKLVERKVSRDGLHELGRMLSLFEVLPFTGLAANAAANLLRALRTLGVGIEDKDLMQAGQALALGRVYVTDDRNFARLPGLQVENWRR